MKIKKNIFFGIIVLTFPIIWTLSRSVNKNVREVSISRPRIYQEEFLIDEKFKKIIDLNCSSKNKSTRLEECLENISILDEYIKLKRVQNKIYHLCDDCFKDNGLKKIVYHHTFWQLTDTKKSPSYNFKRRVLFLNLMSFFFTQNLCCTKYIFWKLKNFPAEIEADIVRKFSTYLDNGTLEIKEFDLVKLCEISKNLNGSLIYKYPICKENGQMHYNDLVSLSDLVRFIVLDIYGGIYVDGDVIFLKETNLLWKDNFAYKWSYTDNINTAIIGMNKYFRNHSSYFYDRIFSKEKSTSALISSLHPFSLSSKIRSKFFGKFEIKIYHSFLFDSAWLCFDGKYRRPTKETVCGFDEFNNKNLVDIRNYSIENFFKGAFTYHLHLVNCGLNIRNDSIFYFLEKFYSNKLRIN